MDGVKRGEDGLGIGIGGSSSGRVRFQANWKGEEG